MFKKIYAFLVKVSQVFAACRTSQPAPEMCIYRPTDDDPLKNRHVMRCMCAALWS